MKNQFIITVAFIAITSFTSQLFAQASSAKTADWDLSKGKGALSCRVVSTEEGCSFTFQKIEMSSREAGSGMASGKRQHKPFRVLFEVSSSDNSVTEVVHPHNGGLSSGERVAPSMASDGISDASPANAQGSGKVNVQDISLTKSSGGGTGKVSMQDFHFSMKGNGKTIGVSCPSGDCTIPTDLPDGEYTLSCDWSWGMSQSGTMTSGSGGKVSPKRCAVDFLLEIENGACVAINQKGTGAAKG